MSVYNGILGQDLAISILQRAIEEERVSGSYLFIGPDGVGKQTTALAFAARLCGGDQADTSTLASIQSGTYADFRSVAPTGASQMISIAQIWPRDGSSGHRPENAMLRDLHFEPIRGKKRVFLIRDAEGLGKGKADSGNSLLKTLEEPPPYAHFILTAETPAAVPQTILSRCQIIRFHRVPTPQIHTLLERNGIEGHLAEFLAAYSEGRPGMALRLAKAPGLLEARSTILQIAHSLVYSPSISGFKLSEEFRKTAGKLKLAPDDGADAEEEKSSRDTSLLGLDLVATYFRDLLAAVVSGESARLAHPDLRKETMVAARHISATTLQSSVQRILAVRGVIARNANSQLAIDVLFTGLAGIAKT